MNFPHLQKNSSVLALDVHEEDRHGISPGLCDVPAEQVSSMLPTRFAPTVADSKSNLGRDKYGIHC